ncbi:hypothetical protein [Hufsiella ginkgonis]|uniref:Carboxypeptidase regulatory-like domain-containing protein n=1 Tax=Hufsiella ginkgonis TaxID=2695274 RepID=A0A7K1XZT0_9SPHI|nr:hypothetical protein [Hufsiella ginkgonis]MXV16483.1 hypothetical protein [Hufsiella ginkgonis]
MKKILLVICLAALFASCKKTGAPVASAGAITGSITPPGVFAVIYATDASGNSFSAGVSPATGAFKLDNLPAGKYRLFVPANPAFNSTINLELEVKSGQTADAGNISFEQAIAPSGSVYGTVLPAGFGKSVTATVLNDGRVYTAIPNASTGSFTIILPNGEYAINFAANAPAEAPQDMRATVEGKPLNLGSVICKQGSSGSITGKMNPVSVLGSVKATSIQTGDVILGTIDRAKGSFGFPVLFPGAYKISFTTYIPYLPHADIEVAVTAGKETDMGTVSFQYDNEVRVLSYKIDGKSSLRYNLTASFADGLLKFSLQQTSFSGPTPENMLTTTTALTVALENVTGPGKYTFRGTANSNLTFSETKRPSYGLQGTTNTWSVNGATAGGQLEVISIDPAARTIRGTFSATLASDKPATLADKSVTEGVFYLSY